jgi:hypothetical protein
MYHRNKLLDLSFKPSLESFRIYSYLLYCYYTSTKSYYLISLWTFFVTTNLSWYQMFLLNYFHSIHVFRLVVFIIKWLLCQKQARELYYISLSHGKDLDLVTHKKASMHSYRTTRCHIPENNNHHNHRSVVRTSGLTHLVVISLRTLPVSRNSILVASCFHTDFLLGLFFYPEDGGDIFLRNVG